MGSCNIWYLLKPCYINNMSIKKEYVCDTMKRLVTFVTLFFVINMVHKPLNKHKNEKLMDQQ